MVPAARGCRCLDRGDAHAGGQGPGTQTRITGNRLPSAIWTALQELIASLGSLPRERRAGCYRLVARVREQMRRLRGEWRAVPFGSGMELTFGPDET